MMRDNTVVKIDGWSMRCGCHNYITLYFNGKFVHCYDNDLFDENPLRDEYYTEHIIASIERRTRKKITEIPIIGSIEDFDGMRFSTGFRKGCEWLNSSQVVEIETVKK